MAYKWYKMKNRNGSYVDCQLIYFPINTDYKCNMLKTPECVIQIPTETGWDFRQLPMIYLEEK